MSRRAKTYVLAAVAVGMLAGVVANGQFAWAGAGGSGTSKEGYTDQFFLDDCTFSTRGSNRFFILEPNYRLILRGEGKHGSDIELTITVLKQTQTVDGVETRVVEERETVDGELVEVSQNFFAICEQTNSLFYFGEQVDFYEDGIVVGHAGSWLAGEDDAEAGVFMPGIVLLGARYQEETAPDVAMDRGEIVSLDEVVETPAGNFGGVLKIMETTPLEPGVVEYKYWAPNVGLIQDGELTLEEYGFL